MTDLPYRAAVWLVENPRPALAIVLALAAGAVIVLANLTWVYFITDKKGEAVRVGIAYFGGLHKRHVAYRKGQDGSTKKGDPWHRRVRWWMPMVPYRLARWAGRKGLSHTGEWPGWLRGGRTVELHLTRKRAKRRESEVIVAVQPRHNYQENPLHQKRPRLKVVA